jgi:hypothetical protein
MLFLWTFAARSCPLGSFGGDDASGDLVGGEPGTLSASISQSGRARTSFVGRLEHRHCWGRRLCVPDTFELEVSCS